MSDNGLQLISDNCSQPTYVAFMNDVAVLGIEEIYIQRQSRFVEAYPDERIGLNKYLNFAKIRREMVPLKD